MHTRMHAHMLQNDELEVLATSASQDKMTTSTLSSEFQSLTETVDQLRELQEKREVEHRTQLQAVQGLCVCVCVCMSACACMCVCACDGCTVLQRQLGVLLRDCVSL